MDPMMIDAMRTDRRRTDRFPIECELVYRMTGKRLAQEHGKGITIDISSGGVRFQADRPLIAGKRVEMAIRWPAQLDNRCNLKLMARGRVVRSEGNQAAVEIQQYEFRTMSRNGLTL
ncbi:MAG: PilZ domain-containing protein [Bryobacteraceae bacterium]|nr:PilZ domain-containing protein [Bryobacteraceae bacterium]MCX7605512.1 PilZ domain-containing protein [Bryobacteraceae bacterium]